MSLISICAKSSHMKNVPASQHFLKLISQFFTNILTSYAIYIVNTKIRNPDNTFKPIVDAVRGILSVNISVNKTICEITAPNNAQ